MSEDVHLECVSDFCGNYKSPGAWADLFERQNGTKYITLGGDWEFYAPNAPDIIDESDPRFEGFLKACEDGDDFNFICLNW